MAKDVETVDLYEEPEIYDMICKNYGDEELFTKLAVERGGDFLELACGAGRIVSAVALNGLRCSALDISERMIEYSSSRHGKLGVEFHVADMTTFSLPILFNCIVLGANTIQLLLDMEDWKKTFRRAFLHLKPQGEFVISLVNPTPIMVQDVDSGTAIAARYDHPRGLGRTSIYHCFKFDREHNVGVTVWDHLLDSGVHIMRNVFRVRFARPQEVIDIAKECGFIHACSYGACDLSPLTAHSPLQIHRFQRK